MWFNFRFLYCVFWLTYTFISLFMLIVYVYFLTCHSANKNLDDTFVIRHNYWRLLVFVLFTNAVIQCPSHGMNTSHCGVTAAVFYRRLWTQKRTETDRNGQKKDLKGWKWTYVTLYRGILFSHCRVSFYRSTQQSKPEKSHEIQKSYQRFEAGKNLNPPNPESPILFWSPSVSKRPINGQIHGENHMSSAHFACKLKTQRHVIFRSNFTALATPTWRCK